MDVQRQRLIARVAQKLLAVLVEPQANLPLPLAVALLVADQQGVGLTIGYLLAGLGVLFLFLVSPDADYVVHLVSDGARALVVVLAGLVAFVAGLADVVDKVNVKSSAIFLNILLLLMRLV